MIRNMSLYSYITLHIGGEDDENNKTGDNKYLLNSHYVPVTPISEYWMS